jgi:pilus assembly protein CpaE
MSSADGATRSGSGANRAPAPAAPPPDRPAAPLTVTVLSAHAEVMKWVAEALGPETQVRLQQWHIRGQPRRVDAIVTEVAADQVQVLCIGEDVPLELAFAVASLIDRAHAHISVILLAAPWPEVWREALRSGVRDVVDPNAGHRELVPALRRALERAAHLSELRLAAATSEPATGRVIVVLSAKGGSGKTMVAANLTAALARIAHGPVALVDLDAQFGDSASALGLVAERTIAQLALVPDIDSTTLKVFLTAHEPSGAFVLCGANSPEEGDNVNERHAARVVELLMRDFACVVVDTAAGIDELTLAALDHATDAVLISTMDVASIRNLGKEVYALDRVGLLPANRHFVLNRADARVGIDVADVRAALGMEIDAAVPSSRGIPLSMNQGRPVVLDDASSPVARELMRLAHRFVPDAGAAVPTGANSNGTHRRSEPTSWFRRRGR